MQTHQGGTISFRFFVTVGTLEQVQDEEKRVIEDEDSSEDLDLGKVFKKWDI